jgi:hypothetical protein
LIILSLWQWHVLFLFPGVGGPRGPNRQCVSTERENDGRETVFAAIDSLSMSCRDADKGRAEGCSSQRKAYNRRYLLNHFPILALLCRLSSEPRLHAHGITVTHHSAGNTKTSSWQRSERAHTHTSKGRPNVKMKIAMPVWEPLFLHGSPAHKKLFCGLVNSRC